MLITDLWSSTDESVWKDAEKNYWKQVKPQNHSVEERLDTLDWHMIQNESVDEFYRFLHDDYFAWKFTDCRFLKTNRTRLSDQYRESREKLDEIQRLLFSFDTDDIDRGLKIVKGISGIGTSAGGLSRILCKVRIRKKGMFVFLGAGQRFLASGLIRILAGNGCRVKGGGVSGRSFYP